MKLLIGKQTSHISSEVLARISIIRPIILALLYGIRKETIEDFGGIDNIKLRSLPLAYLPGDGDVGFCFEWAIHDAIQRQDPNVIERLETAARLCKLYGSSFQSILFGVEKSGKVGIIDTAKELLTDESRVLTGIQAQPPKLKAYIDMIHTAFYKPEARLYLPYSINGLWKADLFFGSKDTDRWLGTTLKINVNKLESARGLRIGIVPAQEGKRDRIYEDKSRNLIVCPIPYDGAFMELFYSCWGIVQQFIYANAELPKEVNLPNPADRQTARELVSRRDYPVLEVIEALAPLSQFNLLETNERDVDSSTQEKGEELMNNLVISPVPIGT